MLKTLTREEPLEISKEETPSPSSLLQSALVHGHGHGRSRELLATPLWSGRGRVWSSACTPPCPPPPRRGPSHSCVSVSKAPAQTEPFTLGVIATQMTESHVRHRLSLMAHATSFLPGSVCSLPASGPARTTGPHTTHQPGATRMHSRTLHLAGARLPTGPPARCPGHTQTVPQPR